jgi:hypothetical protein
MSESDSRDFQTSAVLMDAAKFVFRRVGSDYQYMQELVVGHFIELPASFWVELCTRKLISAFLLRFPFAEAEGHGTKEQQDWTQNMLEHCLFDMHICQSSKEVMLTFARETSDSHDLAADRCVLCTCTLAKTHTHNTPAQQARTTGGRGAGSCNDSRGRG